MNIHAQAQPVAARSRPLTIAVAALGGQGGGVLSDWIVDLAESQGYTAQSTSVPGVAQRTGATVYYIELFPKQASNREPVLALMPSVGDVDVVVAAEFMEAGRAMIRGFVTPDRTTLIASTHRDYAISEKSAMGDGLASSDTIWTAARNRARKVVAFDMAKSAADTQSVISAVLFGALAGSGALPFPENAFEQTIERAGISVKSNVAGFRSGLRKSREPDEKEIIQPSDPLTGATTASGKDLLRRIGDEFPAETHVMVAAGVRRLADYQDTLYASMFLDRLAEVFAADRALSPDTRFDLTNETARHLALWMSYEDTIRVADLKTRASRFARVRNEVRAEPDQPLLVSEFMHPRIEEICETLPAAIGAFILRSPSIRKLLSLTLSKGRRVQTAKISGFILLYSLASLRRFRRFTLKYREEQKLISAWLTLVANSARADYQLGVEIAKTQRLVKGYGDTYARGLGNFMKITSATQTLPKSLVTAEFIRTLREAALADDQSRVLDRKLAEAIAG